MPDISQINIPNNDRSMTYNLKDANVPHGSLPAVSGGTDLSLVTTGEKSEWQDKGNYVVRGTNTTSNTFGHWTGNIPIPELYNGLIITYICSRNTKEVSSCDLELTFPNGSTSGRVEVLFDDGVNITTEYQRERCLTLTYIDANHTSWGDPAWIVIAPSVLQWYVDDTEAGNYPLLFSEYAGRVTLNTTNCGAYKDTTFWYNPSTHNLHAEKVNSYTLAPACEKQVDTEVIESSSNLPTSDAVYNAVNAIHIQTKTASGAIAAFNDAAGDVPFATLKSEINPVQDLHGYSKPWSGGGGKNKLNYNVWKTSSIVNGTAVWENNGVKLTATTNDCYTSAPNGFPSGAIIPISEGETITLSWEENTNLDGSIYIFPNNTTTGMVRAYNQQVKKLSYTATSGVTYVTFRFGVSNNGTTIAYKNIQIEKGSTATAYEPYSNICPISGFSALNVTLADGDMQTVESKTVNFGQTVYGGVADVTNGKVTVTHKFVTFDGSETWTQSGNSAYINNTDAKIVNEYGNGISDQYEFGTWGDVTGAGSYGKFTIYKNTAWTAARIAFALGTQSLADFKTALSNNPLTVLYELATPTEITTTPENLTAISGVNNVFSDTNGDTTVKYFSGDCDGIIKLLKTLMVI